MTSRLLIWCGTVVAGMLLGAAGVLIWAPWHSAQSPTPTLAKALPTTCPALLGLPAPIGAGSGGRGPHDEPETGCDWGEPIDGGFSPVMSTTTLYPTVAAAQRASATEVTTFNGPTHGFSLGADTPIAGVGDDARISDHDGVIVLVARKANVVLSLQYMTFCSACDAERKSDGSGEDSDRNKAVLAAAARTILGQVVVGS
ncbi:MAG TPA: hypothetical protein VGN81_02465 [Pseudonocardiaceae bacterium]|jgi:hypothetical protein